MKCVHSEMNPQERFCSKCGKPFSSERSSVEPPVSRDWGTHVRILAWLFIGTGIILGVPAVALFLFPGLLMLGSLFPPFLLAGPIFVVIALTLITIPGAGIIAGIGLLKYREWGRLLTLVLSACMLFGFPFGTALGIYAFWVLLSTDGSRSYRRRSTPAVEGWSGAPGEGNNFSPS